MVAVLDRLDTGDARRLLSHVALRLGPRMPGSQEPLSDQNGDPVERLLVEIRHHLGVDESDSSEEARTKVFNFVADLLAQSVLAGRETEIKERLVEKDLLRPDEYAVEFTDQFEKMAVRRGVGQQQALDAVKHPQFVERLSTGDKAEDGGGEICTLFVKRYGNIGSKNRYSLLVDCAIKGATQHVRTGWRIYHSEVPCETIDQPLKMLRMFVDAYGLPFRFGTGPAVKFLEGDARPVSGVLAYSDLFEFFTVETPNHEKYEFSGYVRLDNLNVLHAAYCFVIDLSRYEPDLRMHGVAVRPTG